MNDFRSLQNVFSFKSTPLPCLSIVFIMIRALGLLQIVRSLQPDKVAGMKLLQEAQQIPAMRQILPSTCLLTYQLVFLQHIGPSNETSDAKLMNFKAMTIDILYFFLSFWELSLKCCRLSVIFDTNMNKWILKIVEYFNN